jgi:hypothetical protein
MKNEPEVKKIIHKGNGRYDIEVEGKKRLRHSAQYHFGLLSVKTSSEGVTSIETVQVDDKLVRELNSVGVSMHGTFEVRLPKNAEVLSHNASSAPKSPGGTYLWSISFENNKIKTPKLSFKLDLSDGNANLEQRSR